MPCAPRMSGCKAMCLHRQLVEDYRAERERQVTAAEEKARGYATEMTELRPDLVTFRKWLRWNAGRPQKAAA